MTTKSVEIVGTLTAAAQPFGPATTTHLPGGRTARVQRVIFTVADDSGPRRFTALGRVARNAEAIAVGTTVTVHGWQHDDAEPSDPWTCVHVYPGRFEDLRDLSPSANRSAN